MVSQGLLANYCSIVKLLGDLNQHDPNLQRTWGVLTEVRQILSLQRLCVSPPLSRVYYQSYPRVPCHSHLHAWSPLAGVYPKVGGLWSLSSDHSVPYLAGKPALRVHFRDIKETYRSSNTGPYIDTIYSDQILTYLTPPVVINVIQRKSPGLGSCRTQSDPQNLRTGYCKCCSSYVQQPAGCYTSCLRDMPSS